MEYTALDFNEAIDKVFMLLIQQATIIFSGEGWML
jgi:hypothetical protein